MTSTYEPYFSVGYSGLPFSDMELMDRDHLAVSLYECRSCRLLTTSPGLHADWHRELIENGGGRA
ncbi:hypothetical protein J2S59_000274 [Nocardioides massiliensis]|uniref:Uncharacterized protein n=1 Tax=Nocardioides massiliensis TaxID=1325935 RepID=A0ABT9NJ75_9ACTN|nr:hypothetical protein [Nocardioides massiliensis]